VKIFITMLNGS